MKNILTYENFEQYKNKNFIGVQAKNFKQENALLSIKVKKIGDYEYDKNGDTDYTDKIYDYLNKNGYSYSVSDSKKFYFKNPIKSGEVRGFKNTIITGVKISSLDCVVFYIKFEVENPLIDELNIINSKLKKYNTLSDIEFNKVKNEWKKLFNRKNDIDQYIADFTFAYSQSIDPNVIKEVYEKLHDKTNHKRNNRIKELEKIIHKMRYRIEDLSYEEKLDYWDYMDEYNDLYKNYTPSKKELADRKARREKSEEEYKKEQQDFINLINDIDLDED